MNDHAPVEPGVDTREVAHQIVQLGAARWRFDDTRNSRHWVIAIAVVVTFVLALLVAAELAPGDGPPPTTTVPTTVG